MARLLLALLALRAADVRARTEPSRPALHADARASPTSSSGVGDAPRLPSRGASPRQVFERTVLLYSAATIAFSPLTEPELVERAFSRALALAPLLRAGLMTSCAALYRLRQRYTLAILLAHELLTDVSADIIAQAVARRAEGVASMRVDWERVPRSACACMLSDDIPFLLWSRFLWDAVEAAVKALRTSAWAARSPVLAALLSHPLTIAVLKTTITQLVYETVSDAVYLAIQAGMRGRGKRDEGWRERIEKELRSKFFMVWRDGLVFWSAAHMVVFLMPIWWLQPIADNAFTLIFNTYLAIVAHRDVE